MRLMLDHFTIFHTSTGKHIAEMKTQAEALTTFTSALQSSFTTLAFANNEKAMPEGFQVVTNNKSLNEMLVVGSKNLYRENVIVLTALMALQATFSADTETEDSGPIQKLLLEKPLYTVLKRTGRGDHDIMLDTIPIGALHRYSIHSDLIASVEDNRNEIFLRPLITMLSDEQVKLFIGVNEYEGAWYYSKENFEELLDWIFTLAVFSLFREENSGDALPAEAIPKLILAADAIFRIKEISEQSGYRFERLKEQLQK